MEQVVTPLRWSVAGLLCLALVVLIGCKGDEPAATGSRPTHTGKPPPPPGMPGPIDESEPHAAGKVVFNKNGCFQCHTVDGSKQGPHSTKEGPDLAKVAREPGRDLAWFTAFVGNPMHERPGAKMPPFEKQIKPDDMRALAEFLSSLK
jgi:mono/diheme cytochrome c family protein